MNDSDEDSFVVNTGAKAKSKRRSRLPTNSQSSKSVDEYDSFELDEQSTASINRSRLEKRRSAILQNLNRAKHDKTLPQREDIESKKQSSLLSAAEIKQQYDYAMELHVKNKISEKNVFKLNLNLASYIYQKVVSYESGDKVDFQMAAAAIDGATKIWSYKVDAMHKEATQAVKDLIDAKPTEEEAESEQEDTQDSNDKQKPKRRRKLAEVIYKDQKQITNKKWIEIKNPYQQELASKLDSATDISKLRLSTQQIECLNGMSIVPNEDVPRIIAETEYTDDEMEVDLDHGFQSDYFTDMLQQLSSVAVDIIDSENIAPTFNRRTIEDLMKTPAPIVQSQKSTQIEDDMKSVIFENEPLPDMDQFEDQDNLESDEELPPLPPSLDFDEMTSVFGDEKTESLFQSDMRSDAASSVFGNFESSLPDLADLNESALRDDLLERCFDTKIKFRRPRLPPRIVREVLRNEGAANTEKVRKPRAKRSRDEKRKYDLFAVFDEFMFNQKSQRIKKKDESTFDLTKFILAVDFEEPTETAFSHSTFALRPSIRYRRKRIATEKRPSTNNKDNPIALSDDELDPPETGPLSDDDMPASPLGDMFHASDDPHPEDDYVAPEFTAEELNGTAGASSGDLPHPQFAEGDLLQVRQIEKIQMNFERRPRRVNVKLVKTHMWNLIDDDHKNISSTSEKENEENSAQPSNANEPLNGYNFSDLRTELDGVLTGDTKENLTPSMALVCVLYLANERGLELEQDTTNLTDFIIKHPDTLMK